MCVSDRHPSKFLIASKTIAKYENGKVQYYTDERKANKMMKWALKKTSKYTKKKQKNKRINKTSKN